MLLTTQSLVASASLNVVGKLPSSLRVGQQKELRQNPCDRWQRRSLLDLELVH
jgi:hypothetical protein